MNRIELISCWNATNQSNHPICKIYGMRYDIFNYAYAMALYNLIETYI